MPADNPKFVVLVILDGWGIAAPGPGNCISNARLPNFNRYYHDFSHTSLQASGEAVGLPHGDDGNSETGHLNLGAGRIVYQDLPRINSSIADGSFFANQAFLKACQHVKNNNSTLHLMGLIGGGGVHASNEHLYALLRLAKDQKITDVIIHLFTDGRDSPPSSALIYIQALRQKMSELGIARIGTIMGRYWAMDRDNRWSRTKMAYECLTQGIGKTSHSPEEAIQSSYDEKISDEFIKPTVIVDSSQVPVGLVKDNDAVIFYNFRVDRPRQLAKAFVLADFEAKAQTTSFDPYKDKYLSLILKDQIVSEKPFGRKVYLKNLFFVTMTEYEKDLVVAAVAYPPQIVTMPLSQVLSEHGIKQIHISETEKERFVTYYFNGYREQPFPAEQWLIVPSLTNVATYDLAPKMSAEMVTNKVLEKIKENTFKFILVNFANPDMVAHSGKIQPTIEAVEEVDRNLGKIVSLTVAIGGAVIITADHGNAEEVINLKSGEADTKHSQAPVPFIIVSNNKSFNLSSEQGILADVAPTVLKLLQIAKPNVMTGKSLI